MSTILHQADSASKAASKTDVPTHEVIWKAALAAAIRAQRRFPVDLRSDQVEFGVQFANTTYATDLITDVLTALSLSKPTHLLRVVELGSGNLELLESIGNMLPVDRVHYRYGVPQSSASALRESLTDNSRIEVVPTSSSAATTGLDTGCADVVISSDLSGWSGNPEEAVTEALRLVAAGGLLCFTISKHTASIYSSSDGSPESWTTAMEKLGCGHAVVCPDTSAFAEDTLNRVVLAQTTRISQAVAVTHDSGAIMSAPDAQWVDAVAGAVIERLVQQPGIARLLSGDFLDLMGPKVAKKTGGKFKPSVDELWPGFAFTGMQPAYWLGREKHFELGGVTPHWFIEFDVPYLDIDAVNRAANKLIERHAMLRSVIVENQDQRILREVPEFEVDVVDLRQLDEGEAMRRVEAARKRMITFSPDIRTWPLFEVGIYILSNKQMKVFFNISIFIVDGSSLEVLHREFIEFYTNPDHELPPLEFTVSDYVAATMDAVDEEKLQRAKDYWWPRIPELPPAPALPTATSLDFDRRPPFRRRVSNVDRVSWARLKTRAAEHQLTVPAVCCAAFASVLATWARSRRFCMSVMFGSRLPLHPDVPKMVGNFSTTSILEVDATGNNSFEDFAKALRDRLLLDMEHSQITGVDVLRETNRQQGGTVRAAMPVVFNQYGPQGPSEVFPSSWPSMVAESGVETPQVYLENQVMEAGGSAILAFDSLDEVFDEDMLDTIFDAYVGLIENLIDDVTAWSKPVRVVPEAQLLVRDQINATDAPIPDGLLQERFFELAEQHPERPAVISPGCRLNYGELATRASCVATWLIDHGARPNVLIPIVMAKGWEQVVGAMGALRAGAAYMPVDADVPAERLHYLLEQSDIRVAITQTKYVDSLEWPEDVSVLAIDSPEFASIKPYTEPSRQAATDLAYVIFTSGTTGLPKGVMIDHRGALNTVVDINEIFNVGPDDRTFCLSALHFDLSVYDIFGPLNVGGALVIPDVERRQDPEHWIDLIVEEGITIWNSVPALMGLMANSSSSRAADLRETVRAVLLSGDWIPVDLPDKIKRLFGGDIRVSSLGGATEASIWSIIYHIERVELDQSSIPYGKPMLNQAFYVLDEDMNRRPNLVPGELHIGGVGVAKGYWNDPDRTATAFITHPETGEQLYRTGDLGRYLSDGNIEFLGREDSQVKINGYRIELGEIEAALTNLPGVHSSAIVAGGSGDGKIKNRLRGFVVPSLTVTRVSIAHPCGIAFGDGEEMPAETIQLSSTGVHLRLLEDKAAPAKSNVFLRLQLEDDGEQVELAGEIHAQDGQELEVAFDSGSQDIIETIKAFICDHARYDLLSEADAIEFRFVDRRRQHFRAPLSVPCRVRIGEEAMTECTIIDGSERGACLCALERNLDPGTELHVEFTLPNQQALLRTSARVVWNDGSKVGVHFVQAEDEVRKEFDDATLQKAFDLLIRSEGYLLTKATIPLLVRQVSEKLPSYMVPTEWVLLDALPITANGKIDQKKLAAWQIEDSGIPKHGVAPSTQLERQLLQLWSSLLEVPEIGITDDFFDLGGDSVLAVGMMVAVRELVGRDVPISALFQSPTIKLMASSLSEQSGEDGYSSIVPINPIGTSNPLFLVHPIGGTVMCYSEIGRALGKEQRLYGIEAIGLDGKHKPRTSIQEMAEAYLKKMREVQPEGPYLIGGWSMGAIVAYEMARQIGQEGDEVKTLFLIDCLTPTVQDTPDEISTLAMFLRELGFEQSGAEKLPRETLEDMAEDSRVECAWEHACSTELIPQDMKLDQFQNLLDVYRANLTAMWEYEPGDHEAPTIAFHAVKNQQELQDLSLSRFAWDDQIKGEVTHVDLNCDHYEIVQKEHAEAISKRITAW